jgi:hypothetical protein
MFWLLVVLLEVIPQRFVNTTKMWRTCERNLPHMWLALPLFYLPLDQLYLILGRIINDGLMRGKTRVVHRHVSDMLLQMCMEINLNI